MTNAEAITYLKWLSNIDFSKKYPTYPMVTKPEQAEALRMAIDALQQLDNNSTKPDNSTATQFNAIKTHVKGMTACRVPEDDYISRQEAIDVCMKYNGQGYVWSCIMGDLWKLPSAKPEPHYDEWCTDCKEYDQERHCCPRWNRVIRETLRDAQEIIYCRDCKHWKNKHLCESLSRYGSIETKADFYCGGAKRKTDEQTDER